MGNNPWSYPISLQGGFWGSVSAAYNDALSKLGPPAPLSMARGGGDGGGRRGGRDGGRHGLAGVGRLRGDALAGVLDVVTFGWSNTILNGLYSVFALASGGLLGSPDASFADTSSAAYQWEKYGGPILQAVIAMTPVGWAYLAMQAAYFGFQAVSARRGDDMTAVLDGEMALLSAVGAGEALEAADGAIGLELQQAETPALVESEGMAGLESEAGGMTEPLESGLAKTGGHLTQASPTAELPQEPISDYPVDAECKNPGECFTAEMLIDCERGKRPAYTIKEHDLIWSRNELTRRGRWNSRR